MVLGPGGCWFLGMRLSVALRDGGDLEPRTAGQPWYTGEREGRMRRDEPGPALRATGPSAMLDDAIGAGEDRSRRLPR